MPRSLCFPPSPLLLADLKLFQSLSTALFYFYLYSTTIYALRSRSAIPLACLTIGLVLAVLCNVAYPFNAQSAHESAEARLESAESAESDDEADLVDAVVKRPVSRSRAE